MNNQNDSPHGGGGRGNRRRRTHGTLEETSSGKISPLSDTNVRRQAPAKPQTSIAREKRPLQRLDELQGQGGRGTGA